MKFFFPSLSRGKIISPVPVDMAEIGGRISSLIQARKVEQSGSQSIRLMLRHRIAYVGYSVDISIRHRKISYSIDYGNVITAVVVAAFAGLLLFRGNLDTYIFWAVVISGLMLWLNCVLAHGRVRSAIEGSLPKADTGRHQPINAGISCSITHQARCSACGCVLSGFGSACPSCGIKIGHPSESATRLPGWRFKYFYR